MARCSLGNVTVAGRELPSKGLCVGSLDGVSIRERNYDVSISKHIYVSFYFGT